MKTDKVALILPYNDNLEILFQDRKRLANMEKNTDSLGDI